MKKFLALMLTMIIIIVVLTSCSSESTNDGRTVIRIAYLPITHAMPVFVANDLVNDDDNFTVELIRYGTWPELMDALNSGHVDGASVLVQLAMASNERGIDIRAMALGHRDGNIIAVANYIDTVEDLRGRTIAIPSSLSTHNILLNRLLLDNGMSVDDVEVILLAPTEMVSALASGSISAYVVAEPFGARAVTTGVGKSFAESHEIWEDSVCCAFVFSYNFIENNREVAIEFMRKYHAAGDLLEENINPISDHIREIASRHLIIDDETLDISMQWISFNSLDIREQEYRELYDYWLLFDLPQAPPQFDDFVLNLYSLDPIH